MSISAVGNNAVTHAASVRPPPAPPAKDNDGDNDNGAPDVKAATAPGVGANLDIKA